MLRFLQDLFTVLAVVGGVLATIGTVILIGLVVTIHPLPMALWRAVVNSGALFLVGLAGVVIIGRLRLNRTYVA